MGPPEQLPWGDRRRYERPYLPPYYPYPFRGNGRPGPWRYHAAESGRAFAPSRADDMFIGDDSFHPSGYRIDGRYPRYNRDNGKGPFGHRDIRGYSWENGMSPNSSGIAYFGNNQRLVEDRSSFGQRDLRNHYWENGRFHNGNDQRSVDEKSPFGRKELRGKSWENRVFPDGSGRPHNGKDHCFFNDKASFEKKDLKRRSPENGSLPNSYGRAHLSNCQRPLDGKESSGQKEVTGKSCGNSGSTNTSIRFHTGSSQSLMDDKDIEEHSMEIGEVPNRSGKLHIGGDQSPVDDLLTLTSPTQSDPAKVQENSKDQSDKSNSANDVALDSKLKTEISPVSTDWKPCKWSRSGSLSSRGSGFSHSSYMKSPDSVEPKTEMPPHNATPLRSPSGDAAACATVSAVSSEDAGSRKKPRLGWGQGLAKFEKKKVEGPDDDSATKPGLVVCVGEEPSHVHNRADKSPRLAGFLECASPATPYSAANSSSPDDEDKTCVRSANLSYDTSCSRGSPNLLLQEHKDKNQETGFYLENVELISVANLSSSLAELFQLEDPARVESNFVKSTAMNKLLVWRGEALKALEITESEIDSLENDLKKLTPESGSTFSPSATSSCLHGDCQAKPCEDVPSISSGLAPLQARSSEDADKVPGEDHVQVQNEDLHISTSNFVEAFTEVKVSASSDSVKDDEGCDNVDKVPGQGHVQVQNEDLYISTSNFVQTLGEVKVSASSDPFKDDVGCDNMDVNVVGNLRGCSMYGPNHGKFEGLSASKGSDHSPSSLSSDKVEALCDKILASNKDTARKANEVISKLLPSNHSSIHASRTSSISNWKDDPRLMEMFLFNKRGRRFQEKVNILKYRALQHLWKEDLRLMSLKKNHPKSQKRMELSLRGPHCSTKKQRSLRSRFSNTAGNLKLVPTAGVINFTCKLLSDSKIKPYRNSLKMPALIVDAKERIATRFVSNNGLVEDPCAVEKERTIINPWTTEEKEIFMDRFATFGKDFNKISSFLDQKTTADCVEYYYKNHKSESFVKLKNKQDFSKQEKSYSFNNYLVGSGKRSTCETNAASLDVLGEVSAIAANADSTTKPLQETSSSRAPQMGDYVEKSQDLHNFVNDRETEAADVLAGICGSFSSEAMSSCITSSVDRGESYKDLTNQREGSDDQSCSDDSCGEMEPPDSWTDEEKSSFVQAVTSHGNDFLMISRHVGTKSRDQCRVFFSKARKCFRLDSIPLGRCGGGEDGNNGGGSDVEGACVVETDSVVSSEKSSSKGDKDAVLSDVGMNDLEKDYCNDPDESDKVMIDDLREERRLEIDLKGDVQIENGVNMEPMIVLNHTSCSLQPDTEVGKCLGVALSLVGTVSSDVKYDHGFPVSYAVVSKVNPRQDLRPPQAEEQKNVSENNFHGQEDGIVNDMHETTVNYIRDLNSAQGLHASDGNVSNVAAGGASDVSVHSGVNIKQEQKIPFDLNPLLESLDISSGEDSHPVNGPSMSEAIPPRAQDDVERQAKRLYRKSTSVDTCTQYPSSHPVFVGYPLPMAVKTEMNGNYDTNMYHSQDGFLPWCNGTGTPSTPSSGVEFPFRSHEQKKSHTRHHSWSSSDTEKPRSGDVKLFGQILKSQPKESIKVTSENINPKIIHASTVDLDSVVGNIGRNNCLGLENVPTRIFGLWDGNRVSTGFTPLSDSEILLAKYPAAFGHFSSTSSIEQQQSFQSVAMSNSSDHKLNGVSVFPSREMASGSGVVNYQQLYRNQQEIISEMQRQNVISSFAGLRNSMGVVGTNAGISDPVAAIRMHYAKGEQCIGIPKSNNTVIDGESLGDARLM